MSQFWNIDPTMTNPLWVHPMADKIGKIYEIADLLYMLREKHNLSMEEFLQVAELMVEWHKEKGSEEKMIRDLRTKNDSCIPTIW